MQNDTLPENKKVLVFKGKVVDLEVCDSVFNKFGYSNLINIEVEEYWPEDALKFLGGNVVTVFNDEGDCQVHFEKDSSYLVRAYSFNRYLATSICEGTKLLSKSTNDLELLGEGGKPDFDIPIKQQENEINDEFGSEELKSVLLFLSALINLILIVYFFKKNSH